MIRIAILAVLVLVLTDLARADETRIRLGENTETAEPVWDAGRELEIGRILISQRQYAGAIARCKMVRPGLLSRGASKGDGPEFPAGKQAVTAGAVHPSRAAQKSAATSG